ncbi:hypothetical protein SAMN02910353_02238 [Ruminococcus sp. YRD2003]|uniref:hypothetical protein n=1 Tax=Ruminococcus sp. YRD2003 TaxID=1452313 RepID=UPI0008D33069|nr:hypothetical protein SAMN02910353_02238 [Ruminococcus flavefaciens]
MRKFTKEISALLATVAVGTSVNAATAASENEAVKTEGVAMISDTELEQLATTMVGTTVAEPFTTMYEDTYYEGEMMPDATYLAGDIIGTPVTEPIYTVGTEVGPVTTTTTTDEWGGTAMIGTQVGPYTTTTTTETTTYCEGTTTSEYTSTSTEDTWIAGGIMDIHYGDANADGKLSLADSVAILQFIANKDKYSMPRSAQKSADCYNPGDGVTPMDALTIKRVDAGEIAEYDLPVYPDCESGAC